MRQLKPAMLAAGALTEPGYLPGLLWPGLAVSISFPLGSSPRARKITRASRFPALRIVFSVRDPTPSAIPHIRTRALQKPLAYYAQNNENRDSATERRECLPPASVSMGDAKCP